MLEHFPIQQGVVGQYLVEVQSLVLIETCGGGNQWMCLSHNDVLSLSLSLSLFLFLSLCLKRAVEEITYNEINNNQRKCFTDSMGDLWE